MRTQKIGEFYRMDELTIFWQKQHNQNLSSETINLVNYFLNINSGTFVISSQGIDGYDLLHSKRSAFDCICVLTMSCENSNQYELSIACGKLKEKHMEEKML